MGKAFQPARVGRDVLASLLESAIDILRTRQRALLADERLGMISDACRAELAEITALVEKRESIFLATVSVARNQQRDKPMRKRDPEEERIRRQTHKQLSKTEKRQARLKQSRPQFYDPAPMKNPLLQQAILRHRVETKSFTSDNPIGSTSIDDTAPLHEGSSMALTDKPPWE